MITLCLYMFTVFWLGDNYSLCNSPGWLWTQNSPVPPKCTTTILASIVLFNFLLFGFHYYNIFRCLFYVCVYICEYGTVKIFYAAFIFIFLSFKTVYVHIYVMHTYLHILHTHVLLASFCSIDDVFSLVFLGMVSRSCHITFIPILGGSSESLTGKFMVVIPLAFYRQCNGL